MDTLTIKTQLSFVFIGRTLASDRGKASCAIAPGHQPHQRHPPRGSKHDGGEFAYARTVAGYLANDTNATSTLLWLTYVQ
ncbi:MULTISPECIES: hypothetical protein [Arthrobacter]|uniref:Uncharacterized protein n=1 Tax=Arthrobacter bambusae TaxID=1338426 RepID=A0AAW8DLP5_9MICC|nr:MULTISPECIES: hypothetical protein [Arthrobacter]MDP9907261.1 hypothetical protein [Arthrobacter bambusae]MDQ0131397.1 hypothetical protein [Arthrobacter bambusae]MDQ0182731.1 hypothetical protein [Arthrobacter bambusae]